MELKVFQIDSIANSGINTPEMIDFTHIGLYPKQYMTKGLINKIEYYREYVGGEYTDLIVEKVYSYEFVEGVYVGIYDTVNWYNSSDQIAYSTPFFKELLPYERYSFGEKKRNNIIGVVKDYVLTTMQDIYGKEQGLAYGYDLVGSVNSQIIIYIQGPITPLTTAVQNLVGVKVYMTQDIADNIISILTDV